MKRILFCALSLILLLSVFASSYFVQSAGSETGLVGYWKFDEGSGNTAYDSSGYNNNGLINGPLWTGGTYGNALQFDGIDDYVDCGNDASLNITGNLTIMTWVRFNAIPSDLASFVSKDEGPYEQYKWEFDYARNYAGISNALVFHINGPDPYPIGGEWLSSSVFTPAIDQWYHIAVVKSNNNYIFYLNGVNYGEDNAAYVIPPVNAPVEIGRSEYQFHFNGSMDEVKIYNRALSAQEISAAATELVGYWKFDEGSGLTTSDSSGNGNMGTLVNMNPNIAWVKGKYGEALSFDGVDDYVDVGNAGVLNPILSATHELWVRLTGGLGVLQYLTSKGEFTLELLKLSTDNVRFQFNVDYVNYEADSTSTLTLNRWYHIVGTWDGDYLKIYINGKLEGISSMISVDPPASVKNFTIGSRLPTEPLGASRVNGIIDEVKIYNGALSAEEIFKEYERGIGLVGYWKFDEGSGNAAYDSSGNGNTGTLVNGPSWTNGKIGNALNFDGVDDYVEVPYNPSLDISDAITINAWVKWDGFGGRPSIINKRTADNAYANFGISAEIEEGRLRWGWQRAEDNQWQLVDYYWTPNLGQWYHIATTYESIAGVAKIYVNGIEVASRAISGKMLTGIAPTLIGRSEFDVRTFNGTIEEVKIYNRALSADEIRHQYEGLVGHWRFDEISGNVASDGSGNGNTGSLVNGPLWTNGKYGNALSFDGIDDYVEVPDSASLDLSYSSFTVTAWSKRNGTNDWQGAVVATGGSGWAQGFLLSHSYDGFWAEVSDGAGDGVYIRALNIGLYDGNWHHLALVVDRSSNVAYGYVDGIKVVGPVDISSEGDLHRDNTPTRIGRLGSYSSTNQYFNGTIDEVGIYNRALSADEISFQQPDLAVTNTMPSKTIIGKGFSMSINATVENQGNYAETFTITVYTNATPIASQTVTLSSGNSVTVTFTWNTHGVAFGSYTISAYVTPVSGEIDIVDNTFTDGTVLVGPLPGDVNEDGAVDVGDLGFISSRWYPGPPIGPLGYDSKADINKDGAVDIADVGIVSAYWAIPKGPLAP